MSTPFGISSTARPPPPGLDESGEQTTTAPQVRTRNAVSSAFETLPGSGRLTDAASQSSVTS